MSWHQRVTAVLFVAGLLLVTNQLWLFPHAGETQYIYRRAPVVVENGVIGVDSSGDLDPDFERGNYFDEIACDSRAERSRTCGFDSYLLDHGPVTVPHPPEYVPEGPPNPQFVRLSNGYGRRIIHYNNKNDSVTYDVKQISAQKLLEMAAHNISRGQTNVHSEDTDWGTHLVVTGDTERSRKSPTNNEASSGFLGSLPDMLGKESKDPDAEDIGAIYHYNGNFYTVVFTRDDVDRPGISTESRVLLIFVGLSLGTLAIARRSEYHS